MMTLQQIRNAGPCANGWRTLLESLGGSPPMDTVVSLGDIARSNGAADAFWAIRCTDWPAIRNTMRDQVLNPLVARAYAYARAYARAYAYAAYAATAATAATADDADDAAADAAADADATAAATDATAAATDAAAAAAAADDAAYAAATAAADADATAAATAEREKQRADIIAAFPPLHS